MLPQLWVTGRNFVPACLIRLVVRFWPIASFRVAHRLRRFRREADIGPGGSRDLRRSATSGSSRNIGLLTGGPAKTDDRGMAPDDSAESTGSRLEARCPGSRTGHKRVLSHRWDSWGLSPSRG